MEDKEEKSQIPILYSCIDDEQYFYWNIKDSEDLQKEKLDDKPK